MPTSDQATSSRQASPRRDNSALAAGGPRSLRQRKKFVLCFDGTGNKFSGTEADSNILKIYRMLDRDDNSQFHYYQPGIGTYIISKSWSHTSHLDRLKSWYVKAKDSAVGTSFSEHVMGGYKFLMRYYVPGDDIYLFGFSRGAYTARFLAEMLDHVGLLSAGNEEMCRFAWKTFQKWQCRQERNDEEKKEKKRLLEFMCAFRETFSRPVRRIRFLGLFDTVNSVPQFENAWMQRSKFPYTARSSAKVIRHAVAIDERRAKFRQDLISQEKPDRTKHYHRRRRQLQHHLRLPSSHKHVDDQQQRGRKSSDTSHWIPSGRRVTLAVPEIIRDGPETAGVRNLSPGFSITKAEDGGPSSRASSMSGISLQAIQHHDDSDLDVEGEQDIQEVWFPGCHADIGGGWPVTADEAALSHVPLVWMVREAQRAGLNFDGQKLKYLNCYLDEPPREPRLTTYPVPEIENPQRKSSINGLVSSEHPADPLGTGSPALPSASPLSPVTTPQDNANGHTHKSKFHTHLHSAATTGKIHDVLQFHNGVPHLSVISWNIMEYLPFRRMDLQPNGSWKSIVWPLPKGEVRDIPDNAVIHNSVIRRMQHDQSYRPGNLIVGGGGRGVRRAPGELGIGRWRVCREEGDAVGECVVRAEKSERTVSEKVVPVFGGPMGPQGVFVGRKR